MAAGKKATDDELSKLFEGLGEEDSAPDPPPKASAAKASAAKASKPTVPAIQSEQDLLAELDNLAAERPASRPHTPKIAAPAGQGSAKRGGATGTPPPTLSSRGSEDRTLPRKSGESTRSFHRSLTPSAATAATAMAEVPEAVAPAASSEQPQQSGGWWGGIFATASAAVKQAEAAVKEIQKNEEAQRWAEQVKGNVGALRGIGDELRSRALPTFSNILHTLAPPISSHERLQIHITHDFIGYPSLDPLIYQTFSRVMAQVEGGDLMVIQRGHESSPRRASDVGFTGSSSTGWSDGPWWRQANERRDIGAVKGLTEGTKLVRASAEAYANDYFASRGGVEEAAKQATEDLSESNPVRSSDIFLAIQAISQTATQELFQGSTAATNEEKDQSVEDPGEKADDLVSFGIYLHDPVHGITFQTLSQNIPQKWLDWLDAPSQPVEGGEPALPEEIAEIIESGGVDPREWVAEWIEEVLALGVGVVAQRYVARRMGVGEGGLGKGKAREQAIESGAGEAARAL
ncbi:MAG: hypothetical protein M1819_004032 [Sarea resinae]|nr:MAG: hypothetical protein M1819_004032 [Sarea resinae]